MRISSITCGLLLLSLPAVSVAAGPVPEPHALVYIQAHWSGRVQDTHSTLGLRLDRTAIAQNGVIEYQRLLQQPAVLDFRLGREGVQMFSIAGTDYAQWYRIQHADEASGSTDAPAADAATPAADAEAASEKEATSEKKEATASTNEEGKEEKQTIGGILDKAPVGVIMGVGLGIFLLTGLGG